MKINKISVENLGIYKGYWEFDLSAATRDKPIILFGGLNGAGKTTLFDGIRLCLYGKNIFKSISEAAYQDYLKDKIHRPIDANESLDSANVELIFEFAEDGQINEYRVRRSWKLIKKKISEHLEVYKNDKPFDDMQENLWQDFINELIPIGVSQLFFFDGEKIQNIISDNDNHEFVASVKSLLGIDILERLQADITIYQNRNLKEMSSAKEKKKLEKFEKEISILEDKISKRKDKTSSLITKIMKAENQQKRYKNKIIAQGGAFYNNQNELYRQKITADQELESIKEKLRELTSESLPIALAGKLAIRLKGQLQREEQEHTNRIANKKINDILDDFRSKNSSSKFSKEIIEQIKLAVTERCIVKGEIELFGLSTAQTNSLISMINYKTCILDELNSLSIQYEKLFRKLQAIQQSINSVPEDDLIKTMYDSLAELSNNLGALINEKEHCNTELVDLENELKNLHTGRINTINAIGITEKNDRKMELTQAVDNALREYKLQLAKRRIKRFQDEFLYTFNELHRKDDLVCDVVIDPEVLLITMFDNNGSEIAIDDLSSGEKEIYAIALLHALAKTSGMNLPFIIDTPLGRLDSAHRERLVELFFPEASHQMIIFSTDSEIGKEYYEKLQPHTCASYNINYDNSSRAAQVEEGYFAL